MLSDLALVVAVLLACVWVARGTRWAAAIECSLPLLAVAIIVFPDERARLFACGVIVAVAFAGAALVAQEQRGCGVSRSRGFEAPPPRDRETSILRNLVLMIAGVALLRWIPLREVEVWRELVVLAGALALYAAIRPKSALALIAALAVAAVTPVHPGKAALIPLVLAAICVGAPALGRAIVAGALLAAIPFVRWSLIPILVTAAFALLVPYLGKLRPLAYAAALALFALWPWSGIVARALPVMTRFEPPSGTVRVVGWALGRGEEATMSIPRARHVIVNASAAGAEHLPAGTLLGTIDAGTCTRSVRIGDVADFGFTRRPHFFFARNPLPRITRADIRGYGATSWLHGAGAIGVACSSDFTAIRFRAGDLPSNVKLQIESIELPAR